MQKQNFIVLVSFENIRSFKIHPYFSTSKVDISSKANRSRTSLEYSMFTIYVHIFKPQRG